MAIYTTLIILICLVVASTAFWLPFGNHNKQKNQSSYNKADETLVASHVLFRHGNRTPEMSELYPNDPYLNYSYYPLGHGQLTNAGKRREYSIGKALRERYDTFLGEYYTPNSLEARSTDRNRTKMSLLLVLASLYPPRSEEIWNNNLDWQPVPYNYVPEQYDELLFGISCPNYLTEYEKVTHSAEVQSEFDQYNDTLAYISKYSGLNATTFEDVYDLYFGLSTEEEYGFKLPEYWKPVWPQPINEIAFNQYYIYTKNTLLKKLATGYLIKKIIEDSEKKVKNEATASIYLYSAHENNIGQLLATLDLFEYPHIPTYGSYVLMELHLVNGTYGIKIYYQNYNTPVPKLMKLPACDYFCPLEEFKSLLQEYIPEDGLCGT